ncbi:MAG: hypothetical protein DRI61_14425 [Chloroflexi bacterium]|nr:MAG: hypothetical protein DRI61_14425 [Chloroflexota bacterium]HDN81024.1 hypothetical protein [Chloroflexota bacterium]
MDLAMDLSQKVGLALALVFLLLLYASRLEVKARGSPPLRPLRALESLRRALNRAIESGKPVHVSIGTGSIGERDTAESMAGLAVLGYVEEQGSYYRTPVLSTFATPSTLVAAYDARRKATEAGGTPPPGRIYFLAPQKIAYAAGASEVIKDEEAQVNVMIGSFGYEYLLLGEMTEHRGIEHIGGTTDPRVLPFVYASSENYLLGEEIFAANAYLSSNPGALASLLAQDRMRTLLAVLIVVGMILKSLGVIGG